MNQLVQEVDSVAAQTKTKTFGGEQASTVISEVLAACRGWSTASLKSTKKQLPKQKLSQWVSLLLLHLTVHLPAMRNHSKLPN